MQHPRERCALPYAPYRAFTGNGALVLGRQATATFEFHEAH
jgi:hypothetical protein